LRIPTFDLTADTYLDTFGADVKNERESIRNFKPPDMLFGNFAKVHQQPTDRILATRNEDTLALIHGIRYYTFSKVWDGSVHTILERLALWKLSVESWLSHFNAANHTFLYRVPDVLQELLVSLIVSRIVWRKG
jgi:hypothetical protein